jgi:hypothetical protein
MYIVVYFRISHSSIKHGLLNNVAITKENGRNYTHNIDSTYFAGSEVLTVVVEEFYFHERELFIYLRED